MAVAGRRPRGRILYSLLLLVLAVGPVPLLWTSLRLVSDTRDRLELEQKALQLSRARSLSQQVAMYVQSLQAEVRAITQTLELQMGTGHLASRIEALRSSRALERFVDPDGPAPIFSMSVVGLNCQGTGSGVLLPEASIERLMQEGCLRAAQSREMVSPPVYSAAVREPIIVISLPLRSASGASEGAVVAVASLRPLWTLTREMAGGGVDVYVIDSRGWLVAHSDPAKLEEDRDVSNVEIVRAFLESGGRASSTQPFTLGPDHQRMLGTFTAVPDDSGWGVIVQVSEAQAYYSVNEARRDALLLILLVALVAVGAGFLIAGQLTKPIQALARGAHRVASGDYAARVEVRSGNEVGVLAQAFNHMGEEIQKAIEEIRKAAERNRELFVGSIRMLANAIDEKDPYTRGHSDRVAYYSRVIAQKLGMDEEEVERVYLTGILHDVGKIGIEDRILRKAGALTDEEYEIMKQHPRKGEYILAAVPVLKDLTGDGLKHHENVDGSGYPDGLKGEEIPLLGRIVCVADAFDAMTTDRPYSKAWTFERALARLKELAGKKFDGECVGAMAQAIDTGELTPARVRQAIGARRAEASA